MSTVIIDINQSSLYNKNIDNSTSIRSKILKYQYQYLPLSLCIVIICLLINIYYSSTEAYIIMIIGFSISGILFTIYLFKVFVLICIK